VRSDLANGMEEDGTPFQGLRERRPVTARLTAEQVAAMVHKAIGFGGLRNGGLHTIVRADDWVVILTGRDTDPRVTGAVIAYLKRNRLGARLTLLGHAGASGAEFVSLPSADRVELPVPLHSTRSHGIPKIVQNCDRLITSASLETLAVGNYAGMAEKPVEDERLGDLFEYHRADYAIVSGTGLRRNIVFAGPNATATDTVAGAATGRSATYLKTMKRRGFGETDPDAVWVRGNTLGEAKAVFANREARP
jgi:hypothetical protein